MIRTKRLSLALYPGNRWAVYSDGVAIFIHPDHEIALRRLRFLRAIRREEWNARAIWCKDRPALAARIIAAALAHDPTKPRVSTIA